MRRDVRGLLLDTREAAAYIGEDTAEANYDDFLRDRRMRQLVLHNFIVIGEAMNRLKRHAPALAARITAYQEIIGMRNVLVHGYDIVQPDTVWNTVQNSLPVLQSEALCSWRRPHSSGSEYHAPADRG